MIDLLKIVIFHGYVNVYQSVVGWFSPWFPQQVLGADPVGRRQRVLCEEPFIIQNQRLIRRPGPQGSLLGHPSGFLVMVKKLNHFFLVSVGGLHPAKKKYLFIFMIQYTIYYIKYIYIRFSTDTGLGIEHGL